MDRANRSNGANERLAVWREISGITVENFHALPEAEYRAGVGKLMAEVERLMQEEIERGEDGAVREPRITGVEAGDWPGVFSLKRKRQEIENRKIENRKGGKAGEGRGVETDVAAGEREASLTPRAQTAAPVGPLPDGEGDRARSYLWDPVRTVCRRLEISHSMLSYLSKEHSGMAAHEIGDRIRARKLKPMFWGVLRKFAQQMWGSAGARDLNQAEWEKCARRTSLNGKEYARKNGPYFVLDPLKMGRHLDPYSLGLPGTETLRKQLWDVWAAYKRSPAFDRNVWAMECGFPNWARMRRACLLEYGMTPQQLEFEIVNEIAEYYDAACAARDRQQVIQDKELPEEYRLRAPYMDKYSAWEFGDGEWVRKMGIVFGVPVGVGGKG